MTMEISQVVESKIDEKSGWNCMLSLPTKNDVVPLIKLSKPYPSLSQKSLDMCTEGLGSETGSKTNEWFDSVSEVSRGQGINYTPKATRCFPPPMSSVSGSGGVRFKRHVEDGGLVVMLVKIEVSHACFEAVRENGRLKLHFTECMECDADEN